jgi:predicted enzyme related to lactoylglutathione lyase
MNKMNPVVHFEMPLEDKNRMADFYRNVFDWQIELLGPEMGEYVLATTTETDGNGRPKNPGTINGGFYKKMSDGPAQYPTIVISVDDIEASMQKVTDAGGTVLGEPQEIPEIGKFVYFRDTEDNVAGILQAAMME